MTKCSSARGIDAVLLTSDKDFGELVFRQHLLSTGVVLLRLSGFTRQGKIAAVVSAIEEHGQNLKGKFAVLAPGHLRIREA